MRTIGHGVEPSSPADGGDQLKTQGDDVIAAGGGDSRRGKRPVYDDDATLRNFAVQRKDEPLDALGVPNRVHYHAFAAFALYVGLAPLLWALTPQGSEIRHPVVVALCLMGVITSPVILVAGRRRRYEFRESVFFAVLVFSALGTLACQQFIHELRAPVLTLMMLAPIGGAYYLRRSRAIALVVIGTGSILLQSARIDEPDAMLRGFVVAAATFGCAVLLSLMKRHLVKAIQTNREAAERDALTGAYNVRKLDERLTEEIAHAARGRGGFCLIQFDLDEFKQVNDTYNHTVGDAVLVATADAIASMLTPADLLVRRGGDEFMVIAPATAGRNFEAMVDLACARIAAARAQLCPDITPTASAGWAAFEPSDTPASLMARTDQALLERKQLSRADRRSGHCVIAGAPADDATGGEPESGELVYVTGYARIRDGATPIGDDPISGVMRVAWRLAGATTLLLSVMLAATGAIGETTFEFTPLVIGLLACWAFVMSPIAIALSFRDHQPLWMAHLLSLASLGLITLSCLAIGDAAPVAVELFMLAVVTMMALLPSRSAIAYSAIAFAAYTALLYANDYAHAGMRASITLVNFGIIAALLTITRNRTIDAAGEKARLARTDALTGLPNMRRLHDRLAYEIRRCELTGGGLSLLMLDLDDFKSVNDDYGHSTGDEVLLGVAAALERTCRRADMPARRGGDEFVVVLTETGPLDADVAVERVGVAIRRARLRITPDINPNASIGHVAWAPGQSPDELIHQADEALKRVKHESRKHRGPREIRVV